MIELVLRDESTVPSVERLPGPVVRLTVAPHVPLGQALECVREELHAAVEWALHALYSDDDAPSRVYVRDAGGHQVATMTDPCVTYGLQAIVRS